MTPETEPTLVISEVFGPTVQGEGPTIGRRAAFVRLGRCNLDCSWCDTPYTWDWERYDPKVELHERPVPEIVADLVCAGESIYGVRVLQSTLEDVYLEAVRDS